MSNFSTLFKLVLFFCFLVVKDVHLSASVRPMKDLSVQQLNRLLLASGVQCYNLVVVIQENDFITNCSSALLDTKDCVHMYAALLRK